MRLFVAGGKKSLDSFYVSFVFSGSRGPRVFSARERDVLNHLNC